MKFFLVAFFAFIAVVSGAYLPVDNNLETVLAQNEMVQVIRDDLNILRRILKYYEPFLIPNIPEQHIAAEDIALNIELKEVKVYEAEDYTIDYTRKNNRGLGIDVGLTLPKVHFEGQYKVSGSVRKAKVNGSGNVTIDIDKLVLTGTIQMQNVIPFPKVKEIDMDYHVKGLKVQLSDLSIEGMGELVNSKFYEYLQSSKKDVCDVISRQFVQEANNAFQAFNNMIEAYLKLSR